MRSIYGPAERPAEDLTARARIRDAAMAQFAERGLSDATLRDIADTAGVSVGLVHHHFRTKERLRQACDERVLQLLGPQMELIEDAATAVDRPDFASLLYDNDEVLVRYVARMIVEGTDAGNALFDWMAVGTERFLTQSEPELFPAGAPRSRDAATVLMIMHLGMGVLRGQLTRRLDVDVAAPAVAPRVGLLMLDVYEAMGRWVTSDVGGKARAALATYVQGLQPPTDDRRQQGDDHDDI
jgi:AcrR family transcriptional regulator